MTDSGAVRRMTTIALFSPLVLLFFAGLHGLIVQLFDGGPMRLAAPPGVVGWIPGFTFLVLVLVHRMETPRTFRICFGLLMLSVALFALTFAGLSAAFDGSRGSVASFAISVLVIGLFFGAVGFVKWRRKR